ncbi:hypothetical protein K3495_g759 [Podosphaera aphanis]|nr:hypothetical protein K3495_g759 [Podosphaera aphanis]
MDITQKSHVEQETYQNDRLVPAQTFPTLSRETGDRMVQASEENVDTGEMLAGKSHETNVWQSQDVIESPTSIAKGAAAWAANFEPPGSPGEIKTPQRRCHRKRRRVLEGHEIRSKRLRPQYNYEYRDLLNLDIQRVASKTSQDDLGPLEESQIGSSNWETEEKRLFFEALATLGRDNVREIARRVGSKSEVEVQQYLLILQQNTKKHLTALDIPAAIEISEECCSLLEIAADAIAAREECTEVKTERKKWGDVWLVTRRVCQELDRHKTTTGETDSLERISPIARLFILKNWLQLSERVFMNSARAEDDNWISLAEVGETPAVRATAFEDFYSLAVSITKKLISTAFFCTMSRLKARDTHKPKRLEINTDDVDFAVNTLGLKPRSDEFWAKCARRCHLDIIDDSRIEDARDEISSLEEPNLADLKMNYDEVEAMMGLPSPQPATHAPPSQVEPSAHNANLPGPNDEAAHSGDPREPTQHVSESESAASITEDESELQAISPPPQSRDERRNLAQLEKYIAAQQAQDHYTDAIDIRASRRDELVLWKILKHDPPSNIGVDIPLVEPVPCVVPNVTEGDDWREYLEYCSEWEIFDTPIPEKSFHLNRIRKSKVARLKELNVIDDNIKAEDASAQNDYDAYRIDAADTTSQREEPCTDDAENSFSLSDSSLQTDDTMAQFRGLAANFQPSSDESENSS